MQAQREGRGMALIIHNFCTRSGGGGVVNAMPQLLYPSRKETRPGTYWVGLAANLANLAPTKIQILNHSAHSEIFYIFHSRRNKAML